MFKQYFKMSFYIEIYKSENCNFMNASFKYSTIKLYSINKKKSITKLLLR